MKHDIPTPRTNAVFPYMDDGIGGLWRENTPAVCLADSLEKELHKANERIRFLEMTATHLRAELAQYQPTVRSTEE